MSSLVCISWLTIVYTTVHIWELALTTVLKMGGKFIKGRVSQSEPSYTDPYFEHVRTIPRSKESTHIKETRCKKSRMQAFGSSTLQRLDGQRDHSDRKPCSYWVAVKEFNFSYHYMDT